MIAGICLRTLGRVCGGRVGLAAFGAAALGILPVAHAQTIYNLGTLPGGTNSHGSAVDFGGLAVAGYGDTPTSGGKAFRWLLGGGIQDLGTVGPGRYSYGYAISDDGEVVGGWTESNGFRDRGFRWTPGGGMVDLGTIPGGFSSIVTDMSADGLKLGGWSDLDCCSGPRPVRWNIGGGIDNCGVLSIPPIQYAQGEAISADGTTVVGYSNSTAQPTGYRPVRWTQSGGLVDLGDLGGGYAIAKAVSGDGTVVVGESNNGTTLHAVRWVGASPPEDLGALPGHAFSYARAITRDGSTVLGWSSNPGFDTFIWCETFGMQSLTQYLLNDGVNLTGWMLDEVNDVSGNGYNIVGTGRFNGQIRGFLIRLRYPICGPRISAWSQDQVGCADGTVSLFCDGFGPTALFPAFQWQRLNPADNEWFDLTNDTTPWGTTYTGVYTPNLTISQCSTQDAPGKYRCVVYAGCGSRPCPPIQVSLNTVGPSVDQQPQDTTTCPGDSAVFQAGPMTNIGAPYSYQWERETAPNSAIFVPLFDGFTYGWDGNVPGLGGLVTGSSTAQLTIAPDTGNARILGAGHSRAYRLIVSNACGSAASLEAGLKAFVSCVQADVNCDNAVSVSDIGSFVLLLTNRPAYESQNPNCNPDNGDLNDDGMISVSDIGPFVALLTGG